MAAYYLLENGTDRYQLEDASGLYLLEQQPVVHEGAAVLTGAGTIAARATMVRSGRATLTGQGLLVAVGARIVRGVAVLTGAGTVIAEGFVVPGAPAGAGGGRMKRLRGPRVRH